MDALQSDALVPNWEIQDLQGQIQHLWDHRQKHHVALVYAPQELHKWVAQWKENVEKQNERCRWLNVHFVFSHQVSPTIEPGVYIVDRYGHFLNRLDLQAGSVDQVEQELVYYEACHC